MPSGLLRFAQLESLLEFLSGLEAQISFLRYHGGKIYSFHNDVLIRYIDNGLFDSPQHSRAMATLPRENPQP